MIFSSPAKLNLFLRVLRKRPDGYHDLSTLMQTVNLSDTLTIDLASQDTFSCSSDLPMDSTNLVIKALKLFRTHTNQNHPVSIHLDKKIPMQAGLGGGSSNAATTLWALNQLFKTNLSQQALIELGAQLGSDVPFFFSQGRAICEGRGEIIHPVTYQEEIYTIYKFPQGASTAEIFSQCIPDENADESLHVNDLEQITEKLIPSIHEWKKTLPVPVTMTGSGSAYFSLGKHALTQPGWHVRTIFRSLENWY